MRDVPRSHPQAESAALTTLRAPMPVLALKSCYPPGSAVCSCCNAKPNIKLTCDWKAEMNLRTPRLPFCLTGLEIAGLFLFQYDFAYFVGEELAGSLFDAVAEEPESPGTVRRIPEPESSAALSGDRKLRRQAGRWEACKNCRAAAAPGCAAALPNASRTPYDRNCGKGRPLPNPQRPKYRRSSVPKVQSPSEAAYSVAYHCRSRPPHRMRQTKQEWQ